LKRLAGELEQQLPALVLESRPQLNEIGDESAQPSVRRQPPVGERYRHAGPLVRDSELAADRGRDGSVEHVRVDIGLVTAGRQEPGLDRTSVSHALDPPTTLGEPDVTQTSTEETALSLVLGDDAERAEALVDNVGIDAFAVVATDELVAPAPERRQAEAAKGGLPRPQELWVCRPELQLDPAALASGSIDRRVGIRHQLGDDLRKVDPRLGEVLAKVAPADPTVAQLRCVDRHGRRIIPPAETTDVAPGTSAAPIRGVKVLVSIWSMTAGVPASRRRASRVPRRHRAERRTLRS
jgi:hypothetical protein